MFPLSWNLPRNTSSSRPTINSINFIHSRKLGTPTTTSAWKSGPVRFFIHIWKDRDRDQSTFSQILKNRDRNRHRPVHSGFMRFFAVARPVWTSYGSDQFATGPRLVLYIVASKSKVNNIITSTLIHKHPVHCTYCWHGLYSMVWLHSRSQWVRWLSSMGYIGNDRLTFETTGWHSKRQAHIRNDGLMFETMGWHSKRQAHIRNDRLTFETMGWHSKRQAHVRNDGLRVTFETTGWRSKHWAHVRSNSRLAFEMRVLCLKQWALVGVGGLRRHHVGPNMMLSSGGKWGNQETSRLWFASSCTWWVSDSMRLLSYLSMPS